MKNTVISSIKLITSAAAILVIAALLFFPEHLHSFLDLLRRILLPFVLGLCFAFILDKPVTMLARFIKLKNKKFSRVLSTLLLIVLVLGCLALLIFPAVGSLSKSLSLLAQRLPQYLESAVGLINSLLAKLGFKQSISAESILEAYSSPDALEVVRAFITSLARDVSIFSLALILSIYMVIYKDMLIRQCDRLCYAAFSKKTYFFLVRVAMETNKVFSGYFAGKLLQCLLVALATFAAMWALGLPYAMLISIIMGISNIVSMAGPVIGAVPCALLLLLESPMTALWFIVITAAVQFVMGQLVGPKLLGDSTGMSSFWVFAAVIIGGVLGGIMGMIVGIPAFAVLYIFIREAVDLRILKKDNVRFESEYEKVYNRRKNDHGVDS